MADKYGGKTVIGWGHRIFLWFPVPPLVLSRAVSASLLCDGQSDSLGTPSPLVAFQHDAAWTRSCAGGLNHSSPKSKEEFQSPSPLTAPAAHLF
jgi:hypothetical protein